MGVVLKTSMESIDDLIEQANRTIYQEIVRALSYLGEQSVAKVRDREQSESWIDQTGNLRSSIGYAVYSHGKQLMESAFDMVRNGTQGQSEGRRMVESLANQYSTTYAMVVVAGMNYAEFVEARESKDVLASTEIWAKSKIDDYLKKAKERALKKINATKL